MLRNVMRLVVAAMVSTVAGRAGAETAVAEPMHSGRAVIPACEEGVVKDDGVPEGGYGWVPSVVEGTYVQEFRSDEFASRLLTKVCICWMRTGSDDSVDFDVVIYSDAGGVPAREPGVVVPASVSGVRLSPGTVYIGARWNASVDRFLFLCSDRSPATPPVPAFFIDDRADEWEPALETSDPIFDDYKALLVRAEAAADDTFGVPAIAPLGSATMVALLAGGAVWLIRRRSP